MSYSDKETEVQKLQTALYQWGKDTFGDLHSNPVLAKKLKEEAAELHTELERKHHLIKSTFTSEYLDSVIGADEFVAEKLDEIQANIKEEIADCFIMLMHVASDESIKFSELIKLVKQKFEVNKKRRWNKPNASGIIKHKK